jgi:hypothetical protein
MPSTDRRCAVRSAPRPGALPFTRTTEHLLPAAEARRIAMRLRLSGAGRLDMVRAEEGADGRWRIRATITLFRRIDLRRPRRSK